MSGKLHMVMLVAIIGTIFATVVHTEPNTGSILPLRRRYRSDTPEAVRRRLTTVNGEDQLIKDLGDVLYYGRTAVIRFYADWCPVCQSDRPRFLELIDQFPHTNFFRVDVDDQAKLSSEYGIRAVPTYFILRRNMSHITYHSARDVSNYLTQLRQSRQLRYRQNHRRS